MKTKGRLDLRDVCKVYGIHPIERIKVFLKRIKWKRQRIKYGYSSYDLTDIKDYITSLVVEMTKELSDKFISYPPRYTEEEWKDKLIGISKDWEKYRDYNGLNNDSKYITRNKFEEVISTHNENKERAFKVLMKNFDDLWD